MKVVQVSAAPPPASPEQSLKGRGVALDFQEVIAAVLMTYE